MGNMVFKPDYYDRFSCIAGACEDSCCKAGWEIPIDDETFEIYSHLSGQIGEKFKGSYTLGSDGDRVFKLDENKNCPFLDENGLCELYTATGGRLSEICDKYPRFKEEFDGFEELGISISCPEAQRLILSATRSDYLDGGRPTDDNLLSFLADSKKKALDLASESDDPKRILLSILDYSDFLQELIDFDELESLEAYEPMDYEKGEKTDLLKRINACISEELDILYSEFSKKLSSKPRFVKIENFSQYIMYLINRFWLRAINTEDISSTAKAIVTVAVEALTFEGDAIENMRLLAKEIEHGAGNFEALCEIMSDVDSQELATLIYSL